MSELSAPYFLNPDNREISETSGKKDSSNNNFFDS